MELIKSPGFQVVLIAPEATAEILKKRFVNTPAEIAEPAEIRKNSLHAVWHPWGEIGFPTDAPTVLSLHGLGGFADSSGSFWTRRRARRNLTRAIRQASAIVALSHWSMEELSATFDIDPLAITVAPPLPDSFWTPGFQELKNPKLGEYAFTLVVGGWQAHHDLAFIIDLHRRTFHKKDIQLVVCGPLDDAAKGQLAQLPYSLHIEKYLDDGELRGLYRNARAVLHPAQDSHWSQVAAEALCCGAPILTFESASLPEIVASSGFLLAVEDRTGWRDTLEKTVLDDDLNSELRQAATSAWGARSRRSSLETLIHLFHRIALPR